MKKRIKVFLLLIIILFGYRIFNDHINNNQANVVTKYVDYHFRNNDLLNEHYRKHGIEMGYKSALAYEKAASDIVNNPDALYKLEKEDNDYVYFLESSNEIVFVSRDGYIRTYFVSNSGKSYFNNQ